MLRRPYPVAYGDKSVGAASAEPDVERNRQGVGADVGEHNDVPLVERFDAGGHLLWDEMGREVGDCVTCLFQVSHPVFAALTESGSREGIESLDVGLLDDPGFSDEQYFGHDGLLSRLAATCVQKRERAWVSGGQVATPR